MMDTATPGCRRVYIYFFFCILISVKVIQRLVLEDNYDFEMVGLPIDQANARWWAVIGQIIISNCPF